MTQTIIYKIISLDQVSPVAERSIVLNEGVTAYYGVSGKPMHWGHYKTMREILLSPRFDTLMFAPAGCSPDKADDYDQSKDLRSNIAKRIVEKLKREFPNKKIILETYEFDHPGMTTYDALVYVQTNYPNLNPSNFVFVLGQDYIYTKRPDGLQAVDFEKSQVRETFGSSDLSAWNNIRDIFNMVSVAVIPRNYKG